MKHTKPYYYKPKTVKSIAFINYTKLYCRKTSFFYKDNYVDFNDLHSDWIET